MEKNDMKIDFQKIISSSFKLKLIFDWFYPIYKFTPENGGHSDEPVLAEISKHCYNFTT